MLFLVATPIGNLSDISLRAIDTLKLVDVILCEDSRHSLRLLKHYEIVKPLISLHKFNEVKRIDAVYARLDEGQNVALISDAGTPGVCDPGARLIKALRKKGCKITIIPGACAFISALALVGLAEEAFQFLGFIPRTPGQRQKSFEKASVFAEASDGVTVYYESPHRVLKSLQALPPEKEVVLVRELTKHFEEVLEGSAGELVARLTGKKARGEFVFILK